MHGQKVQPAISPARPWVKSLIRYNAPRKARGIYRLTLVLYLGLLLPVVVHGGAVTPNPGRVPLDAAGGMHLSSEDRCPVCAMPVQAHAPFASAIQLKDGRTYYFCGSGCMIRTWLHSEAFLGIERQLLARCAVRDYFSGMNIDGLAALWVAGSDVIGPMGPALVPLKNEADVAAFQRRHGGRSIFRLAEMDDARWEALTGKRVAP